MLRLSRASVISDIEFLVTPPGPPTGRHEWSIKGVSCRLERHSYASSLYSFDHDVLQIRTDTKRDGWEVFIVTEFWRNSSGASIHSPKWLKLTNGKSSDVLRWIRQERERALAMRPT